MKRNLVDGPEHMLNQLSAAFGEHQLQIEGTKKRQIPSISSESGYCMIQDNVLFQTLFNLNPCWTTLSTFEEGCILKANRAFLEFTGFSEDEVIGKTSLQLGLWPYPKERHDAMRIVSEEKLVTGFPLKIRTKFGELRSLIGSTCLLRIENQLCLLTIAEEKAESTAAAERQGKGNGVRCNVEQRLETIEKAVDVLVDCSEQIKSFRESVTTALEKNILPFIETLKKTRLDSKANAYLTIIETNLSTLLYSVSSIETQHTASLTPTEIHVAELVRQGKTSKEISSLLNVSLSAISFHRNNIRKKLGLSNKSISLNNYLQYR